MKLDEALKASRTLGQAVNRSGKYEVMVVETDEALFQNKKARLYVVSVMRDLTTRRCFEPVYESHLGLADIELFLNRTSNRPPVYDLNPEAWEPMH